MFLVKEELCEIFLNNIDQMYAIFKAKYTDLDNDIHEKLLIEKEIVKKNIISKLETPIEKFQVINYYNLPLI